MNDWITRFQEQFEKTGKPWREQPFTAQRERYEALKMYKSILDRDNYINSFLVLKYKHRIRETIRKRGTYYTIAGITVENETCIHSDYDSALIKIDLGSVDKISKAQVKRFCAEIWMDRPNSIYDCTGILFTVWIRYKILHGHWIVYHEYHADV